MLESLSDEKNEYYNKKLKAKQESLKEWFWWGANPHSRSTNYKVFARLYRELVDPIVEETCRIQAIPGKAKLPVWHKTAARLWRNALQEQRDAVNAEMEKEGAHDKDQEDDDPSGESSPETYQQLLLPGVLMATVDPAVRKAGVMAICTFIGPVPEAGGQIIATTHEETYIEHLGRFAQKYEFPEELCTRRSLRAGEEASLSEESGTASPSKESSTQSPPTQTGSLAPVKSAVQPSSSLPGNSSGPSYSASLAHVQPGPLGQDAHLAKPHPIPMSTLPHPKPSDTTLPPPIQPGTIPVASHSILQSSPSSDPAQSEPLPMSTTSIPNMFTPPQPYPPVVPVPAVAPQAFPTNQVAPISSLPTSSQTIKLRLQPHNYPGRASNPHNYPGRASIPPDQSSQVSAHVEPMVPQAANVMGTPSVGLPSPGQPSVVTSNTPQDGPHTGSAGSPLAEVQGSSSLPLYNQVRHTLPSLQNSKTYSQQAYDPAPLFQSPQPALQAGSINVFHSQQPSSLLVPPTSHSLNSSLYGPYSLPQDSYSLSRLYLNRNTEDKTTQLLEDWENSGKTWEEMLADTSLDNVNLSSYNTVGTGNWCDISVFNSIANQIGGSTHYSPSDLDRPTQSFPNSNSRTNFPPENTGTPQPTTSGTGGMAGTSTAIPQMTPIVAPPNVFAASQTANSTSGETGKTLPTSFMLSMASGFGSSLFSNTSSEAAPTLLKGKTPRPRGRPPKKGSSNKENIPPPNAGTPSMTAPPIPPSAVNDPPVTPNIQVPLVHQQESTCRSARGPIKNTWLEKQNLIGTNTMLLSTSVTTNISAEADEGPLPWFKDAVNHLKVDDPGPLWVDAVRKWVTLEALLGYGRVAKTPLPVTSCPEEWSKWAAKSKNGIHPYGGGMTSSHPSACQTTAFPSATFTDPTYVGDPWSTIRKSGPNGLSSRSAFTKDSHPAWNLLLKDICLCLAEMVEPMPKVTAKRDHNTVMADSDVIDSDMPMNKQPMSPTIPLLDARSAPTFYVSLQAVSLSSSEYPSSASISDSLCFSSLLVW
ncbi:hypothetical protein NMY22_g17195 [Coprinellus aureogranulatus]|nr:hypothetical protein NMY22_g17195 [Coprinellus aureogranulatus]